LVQSADLAAIDWLPEITAAHTEARADRFVAAFERKPEDPRDFTFAYVVRAVAPGRYTHPPAIVEDMYRPHLSARTASGQIEIVGAHQGGIAALPGGRPLPQGLASAAPALWRSPVFCPRRFLMPPQCRPSSLTARAISCGRSPWPGDVGGCRSRSVR